MGFKFSYVCDLLTNLDNNRVAKAATEARKRDPDLSTIVHWFNNHEKRIHGGDTDRLALLSCIFPEKRPDRVFNLREPSLVKVIGRCLLLGASRKQELDRWREKGWGDLGQCVEHIMQQAENCFHGQEEVTVEEVDLALAKIASRCRFSGPSVRYQHSAVDVDETLSPIFRRLSSRDGKWFTRLILKDFSPVVIPAQLILRNFHFLLPKLLLFQNSLEGALIFLNQEQVRSFPPRPEAQYANLLAKLALPYLRPEVGVKIGRVDFLKARSLKHCCEMARGRIMSVEKKYDGEYCQIHVNLLSDSIQIFSKSGKDSTADRRDVHKTLRESLRIGKHDCRFSTRCIVECEILVWSDKENKVLPFHKLRRHILRSGTFIGTENDSPYVVSFSMIYNCPLIHLRPDPSEHLYLAFFDVLLVDENICLSMPYRERRQLLQKIVHPIEGYSELARQQTINFSLSDSYDHLKEAVALAAAQRWEGLVLKGFEEPYFPMFEDNSSIHFGRWIKLKKEYIPGLGDSVDLVLIGARYDASDTMQRKSDRNITWTSFFVGCLDGNDRTSDERKLFRVVDVINYHNISPQLMQTLNQLCQFRLCEPRSESCPFLIKTDQPNLPEIEVLFRVPFVVEMVGFGFERPSGAKYFVLRFPRVVKIHSDRGVNEALSFKGLQQAAEIARTVPDEDLSQEIIFWARKLEKKNGSSEYIMDNSDVSDVSSCSTGSASPIRTNHNTLKGVMVTKKDGISIISITPSEFEARNQQSMGFGPPMVFASPITRREPPPNACQTVDTFSHSAEFTSTISNSLRSSSLSNGIFTSVENSTKTIREDYSKGDVPSDPITILTSPLSASGLADVENKPYTSEDGHQSPYSLVKKSTLGSARRRKSKICSQRSTRTPLRETGRANLQNSPKNLSERGTDSHLLLYKAPKLFSTGITSKTRHRARTLLRELRQSANLSMQLFFDKLNSTSAKCQRSCQGSHHARPPCTYGIVFVDSRAGSTGGIASEITRIGNALTKCRQQGRLAHTGKIFFVQWEILRPEASSPSRSAGRESLAKSMFMGCLKWGYDTRTRRRRRDDSRASLQENGLSELYAQQPTAFQVEHDVKLSFNWKEMLPLLQTSSI